MNKHSRNLIWIFILSSCLLCTSCQTPPTLQIDLPASWEEGWVLHQRPMYSTEDFQQRDTLYPKDGRIICQIPISEDTEWVLLPLSSPFTMATERIPYKIHLYLQAEEKTQLSVKGSPNDFQYEIQQGSLINYSVCDFINLYAPLLQAEFNTNQQVYELLQQKKGKVAIDCLLKDLQATSTASRTFVTDYFKAHNRDAGAAHVWLEIPQSQARAMVVLLPHGIRNGIFKERIDQRLQE